MIRVVVCDDHAMVRDALGRMIGAESDIEVVGTTDSAAATLGLLEMYAVDVVVLDVRLGEESGIDLARRITESHPGVRIIMLSSVRSDGLLVEAHETGASAFLLKTGDTAGLVSAIRDVAAGRKLISPADLRIATNNLEKNGVGAIRRLDANDRMIAELIARGYSDKQIAETVYLGLQTVRNRVSRMLSRFDKENRTQLALLFNEHSLELHAAGATRS